jgi:hypothetical protein
VKYVLDANIAIAASNDVGAVRQHLSGVPGSEVGVPSLESRGVVKSDFDLIIARTALDLGATLVTNDQALLDGSIGGLQAENWLS